MIASSRTTGDPEPLRELRDLAQGAAGEIEARRLQLSEISMLAKQMSSEVERLESQADECAERMKEAELSPDNFNRAEMRDIYANVHDTEMRLFVMKGQLEQLETKQQGLQEEQEWLRRLIDITDSLSSGDISTLATIHESQSSEGTSAELADGASPVPYDPDLGSLIEAQEGERQRIARRMHDGPAQALANLILRAEICERLLAIDTDQAKSEMAELKEMVAGTLRDARQFIFDLRPMILDDLGLAPTLRRYGEARAAKDDIAIKVNVSGLEVRLPAQVEIALFRIVQEAIDNAIEHGNAKTIQIDVEIAQNVVRLTVEDNGAGFDPSSVADGSGTTLYGIKGMRQRARLVGGKLSIDSSPGQGARIRVEAKF